MALLWSRFQKRNKSYHGTKNFSAAWRNADRIWDIPGLEKYHGQDINLSEALTLEANAEIEKTLDEGKTFYMYVSHYAIHVPWKVDKRFIDKYQKRDLLMDYNISHS